MRSAAIAAGCAWTAAIVWLSLTPSPPEVDVAHGDKRGHGCRSCELLDMAANTLGVLLGWAAARVPPRMRTA